MSPAPQFSLFSSAMAAANMTKNAKPLPQAHQLTAPLAYARCHHPLVMVRDMHISESSYEREKIVAEKIGKTVAGLMTQACADAGHDDIMVASVVWKDSQTGWKSCLALGRTEKDKPPLKEFPAQLVVMKLQELRREMIGKDAGVLSPHWQVTVAEEEGKGLESFYKWEATDERQQKLQAFASDMLFLQGVGQIMDTNGRHPVLLAVKKEMDEMAAREHANVPPRN